MSSAHPPDSSTPILANESLSSHDSIPEKPMKPFAYRIAIRVFLLSLMITLSLIGLHYFPNVPIIAFVPFWVLIASIYAAYHTKAHRTLVGCLRVLHHVTTIGLWSTFLAWILFSVILRWNIAPYHWLAPYFLAGIVFIRSDAGFPPYSIRAYIVHIKYDIPAIAVIVMYKMMRWPLNRLYTIIDENVVLGCMPLPHEVPKLKAAGVVGVINMCVEYPGPQEAYRQHGIQQLRLPVVDMNCPTVEQASAAVAFIRRTASREGTRVLIHCKNGMGRSAMITLCYLMAQCNATPSRGAHWLKAKRPEVALDIIQSWTVREYHKRLETKGNEEKSDKPIKLPQVTVKDQLDKVEHDKEKAPTVTAINTIAETANAVLSDVPATAAETLGDVTKEATGPIPPIG